MAAGKKKPYEKEADPSDTGHSLRDDAEEQLARSSKPSPDSPVQTPEALIHELQVHQIELEIQAEELRRSKLALEESRDKYLDLYDFAPLGYFTLSDKALITGANLTGAKLLGVERSRLVNAPFSKFVADNDADEWHWYFMNVLNQKEKRTCTLMLKRGGGSMFPAQLESVLITGSDGANTVRIAIIDITGIRQTEEALRESEIKHRALFEAIADTVFLIDQKSGNILDVNPAASRQYGFDHNEFVQMNAVDVSAESEQTVRAIERPVSNIPLRYHHRKDGSIFPVEITASTFELQGKTIIIATARDITERKRAEEAIHQANKKLTLLSSITRHDINNQLLTVNGFLEFLHREVTDPALEDYFTRITNASTRIEAMIRFTKEYEKIGVNAPVWQDCRTLVDTASKQAPLGNIIVKNDLPAGAEVFADPMIVKVFYNLMDNAVRYGGKITTIRFAALEREGDHIVVCEDDGEGVVANEKEMIFKRGFGKNTGLGLTLAREILDITGITIRETGEPGKGARFEMRVPEGAYRLIEVK